MLSLKKFYDKAGLIIFILQKPSVKKKTSIHGGKQKKLLSGGTMVQAHFYCFPIPSFFYQEVLCFRNRYSEEDLVDRVNVHFSENRKKGIKSLKSTLNVRPYC